MSGSRTVGRVFNPPSDWEKGGSKTRPTWRVSLAVFFFVLAAQLLLVALAGTDIPFYDQWDGEGRWLYPAWSDGVLRPSDLFRPWNEHRIVWTHGLNLLLFALNGQWDPLTQMVVGAVLRAGFAAGLVGWWGQGMSARGRRLVAIGVAIVFLPHLAWHNALWGFQSQVYFALIFSGLAFALLGAPRPSLARQCGGLAAGVAAWLAMGAGIFVPVALLGLALVRRLEQRGGMRVVWGEIWPALVLLALALSLRTSVPEHAALRATTAGSFFTAWGRLCAWPHVDQPWAALVLNLPLALTTAGRLLRRREATPGEDAALLLGAWAGAVAAAAAWARGGSPELATGVPSRYVDFLALLPLANAWCAVALARELRPSWRRSGRLVAGAWGVFLLVGWLGLSAHMLRGIVVPRARDRAAPERLIRIFQTTGDAAVFVGQPRLLVPHPDLDVVRAVLADPRMRGKLPPSLQPERPLGPLSRAARALLGRQ